MRVRVGKWFWVITIFATLTWLYLPSAQAEEKEVSKEKGKAEMKQATEDKAAVVNGTVITKDEFDRAMMPIQMRIEQGLEIDDAQLSEFKKNILENLINRELLYQESQKSGIKVDDTEIDKRLVALKKQFPDEKIFQSELTKMNLTEDILKAQMRSGLSVQQFIDNQFGNKITISEKESKAYYDENPDAFKQQGQVKASHILIKTDPKADKAKNAEARKKIEEIQQKLKKGEDFAKLAKESSECPSSSKGGDLGFFGRGQMVKPFEDAAFALEAGQMSDIVETRFGYHLIKVTDKKPETIVAFADVKGKIEEHLKQEKIEKEVETYVGKIKEKAKIERFIQ